MYKQASYRFWTINGASYRFMMNSDVDTVQKSYFVYTYSNGNGDVKEYVPQWQGIPPNNFYIGHSPPRSESIFTITNDKLMLTRNLILTTLRPLPPGTLDTLYNNVGEPLGVFVKRKNFNLYQ
ncbi:MAG: hypothetical protein ACRCR9_01370 [Chitinophagaceae bacterium]